MILKNDIVHCAELLGNASTFFRAKDNTMAPGNISPWKDKLGKLLVDCMIMPEKASVLSRDVQFNSQTTECLPRNAVSMASSNDIRSRLMNSTVNHESSSINSMHISPFRNFTVLIHKNEIRHFHVLEGFEEWIDPEVVGQDGIANRDVAGTSFVTIALSTHPSEGCSHVFLAMLPFLFESGKLRSRLQLAEKQCVGIRES